MEVIIFWRDKGEKIMIGDDIVISNCGLWRDRDRHIKLGIEAPTHISVMRQELKSKEKKETKITYKRKKKIEVSDE